MNSEHQSSSTRHHYTMASLKIFLVLLMALACTLAAPADLERAKKDVLLGTYGYAYPYYSASYAAPYAAYSSYYPAAYSALPYASYRTVVY